MTQRSRNQSRRGAAVLLGTALLMITSAPEARAELRSAKGPIEMHDHVRVTLKNAGIAIRGYRFVRQARIMQKTPFVDGGPSLEIDVANEGTEKEDFAIAVALFDRKGRLVGVGTGDTLGKLEPGEAKQVKVVIKDVNQEAIYATTVQMSLEVKR